MKRVPAPVGGVNSTFLILSSRALYDTFLYPDITEISHPNDEELLVFIVMIVARIDAAQRNGMQYVLDMDLPT